MRRGLQDWAVGMKSFSLKWSDTSLASNDEQLVGQASEMALVRRCFPKELLQSLQQMR